jgi:hypothetical protein
MTPPEDASTARRRRRLAVGGGVAAFICGSAFAVSRKGLFISEDTVFLWVLAGLLALSLGDLGRWGRGVVVDWLPLGVLLIFYDSSHGFSKLLGVSVHEQAQLNFDRWLTGSSLVAVQLQHWLHQGSSVLPWEYPLFAVYMSHFFLALVLAGVLWRFAYPRFRQFRARLIVLNGLGFLTYVVYPAAPPWMVARADGLPMQRVVVQIWNHVGLSTAGPLLERGNAFYNQVAAVPSMHAATSLLILMFFWRRARWWLRMLMFLYVLAMAFVLVDGGEHYLFDIVVGWVYAIAVMGGFALASAMRERRAAIAGGALAGWPAALGTLGVRNRARWPD